MKLEARSGFTETGDAAALSRRSGALKRGLWGLASQGANTLGNLAAALFVATHSTAYQFGGWSVAYACTLGLLPVLRSVTSTPLLLDLGRDRSNAETGATAASFWLGLLLGTVFVGSSLMMNGALAQGFVGFGLIVPAFFIQDTTRYVFISRQRPNVTATMDLAWLAVQLFGFGGLDLVGLTTLTAVTVVWGLSALVSCLAVFTRAHGSLSIRAAMSYLYSRRNSSARLLPDAILNGASTQLLPVVLAITGGLASVAALRAGQTVFGVMGVVVAGLSPIMTVEAVRWLKDGRSAWRLVWAWTGGLGLLGILFSAAILLMPSGIGSQLLGPSWSGARPVVLPLALQTVLRGPFTVGPIILRAQRRLTRALTLRAITSALSLSIPAIAALRWGAEGAAWGIALAALINGGISLECLRRSKGTQESGPRTPGV